MGAGVGAPGYGGRVRLDELTVTHPHSGRPVYRLAGCSQLFFAPPGSPGAASFEELWDVTAECLALRDEAMYWIGPLGADPRRLPGGLSPVRDALADERDEAFARYGAMNLRVWSHPDPPRQQFSLAVPSPDSRERFAQLVMGERPSVLIRQPEIVVERAIRQARLLRPHAGLIGFGLMSQTWMEAHHADSAWPFLQRYPGLQLPYQLTWGADGAGIPAVDWLTLLGDRPLALLGGVDGVRRRLSASAEALCASVPQVLEYEGGAMVRAGDTPKLDDDGAAPIEYRVVDAALRPLRWDGRTSTPNRLLKVRERARGVTRAEATRRWAARFE